MRKHIFTAFLLGLISLAVKAQDYSNYSQQSARLEKLARSYRQLTTLNALTKTVSGKNIWMLTIGTGKVSEKPAIAVLGGLEGNHLLGTELAIGFAEKLLQASGTDSIRNLLAQTTYYIFPNMSPDAMEQYFAKVKYERLGNGKATDDDRDGKNGEDGFDDLDGNGKITLKRVPSAIGAYQPNPDDNRSMVKADPAKGEKGSYQVFTEGLDNDHDGQFNEDGEGGIWFNKNFTFRHPSFSAGAGEFPVSEKETRALLDTLYNLYNVFALVSFSSSHNNLSAPVSFNAPAANQRLIASWLEPDVKVNAMASDLYNKITQSKDAPKAEPQAGGDFQSWAYYHYGRYSFSTPGWWVPKVQADTARKEKPYRVEDAGAAYLRWASRQGLAVPYTAWKAVSHPDFPGQQVEIGGLDPFVLLNPPYQLAGPIVEKHTRFLLQLAQLQPRLELANIRTEKLGKDLSRITVDLLNKGAFAAPSKLGERTYWVKKINVHLQAGANQTLLSGRKIQLLESLEGYGSQQLSWLVKGKGKVRLEAGSPATGTSSVEITL